MQNQDQNNHLPYIIFFFLFSKDVYPTFICSINMYFIFKASKVQSTFIFSANKIVCTFVLFDFLYVGTSLWSCGCEMFLQYSIYVLYRFFLEPILTFWRQWRYKLLKEQLVAFIKFKSLPLLVYVLIPTIVKPFHLRNSMIKSKIKINHFLSETRGLKQYKK